MAAVAVAPQKRVSLTGNDAVAEALRQANPDVAAVYPITPQTELMHKFAQFYADGLVNTELVLVESEHSAMSAAVGAAVSGARTVTATSSQGYALMVEICYIAAALRLPIVMPLVNRALSGPLNIHCDHSDAMLARDTGWIQLWSENSQEAYDNTLMAFRIGEHPDVLTPVIINLDGFIISHTAETLDIIGDEEARRFIGEYKPARSLLDTDHPFTVGALFLPDNYFEARRQQQEAIEASLPVIEAVSAEFGELSGRPYSLFAPYRLDDAEYVLIGAGSAMGTTKVAVDELRDEGIKAGSLALRVYRPFPGPQLIDALRGAKGVAVMDRAMSYGLDGGPIFHEIRSFAHGFNVPFTSTIAGLGGRDITVGDIKTIFADLREVVRTGHDAPKARYVGVRE